MPRAKILKPVIIVDTREKRPWGFEGDEAFEGVAFEKLDVGDYSIRGMEHIVCVERKAGGDELFVNFTKHKERFHAEFERMADHKHKILVIEETCEDILNADKYYINRKKINKGAHKMPAAVVASGLTNLMLEYGVKVVFAGDKGRSMARGILLHSYQLYRKGKL
jgi:ERCC4-type nuclease